MRQPEHEERGPWQSRATTSENNHVKYPTDDIHAAWLAGWESGNAKGRRDASVDLACEWLHAEARRWTDQAVTLANARHGEQWGQSIRAAAGDEVAA